MSLVVVCHLAYFGWLNTDKVSVPIEFINAYDFSQPSENYLALSISATTLMMTGFLVGMVHFFLRMDLLVYGMLLLLLIGEVLYFSGCFESNVFENTNIEDTFNYKLASFCGITGIVF